MTYTILNTKGQTVEANVTIERASEIVMLDTWEIECAIEEDGKCETDTHTVIVD